ncbi:hypothetical protein J4457_04105 [Candidatus Woesearchaeota archaeon]|nr:hypothetical protein [Candidatus Woesearchaeota archaeon]
MSYVEIKTIKGRKYKYLRESIRVGESVTHPMVRYMGPIEPIYAKS